MTTSAPPFGRLYTLRTCASCEWWWPDRYAPERDPDRPAHGEGAELGFCVTISADVRSQFSCVKWCKRDGEPMGKELEEA